MDFLDYWWIIILVIGLPLAAFLSNKEGDIENRTAKGDGWSVDMGCVGILVATFIIAIIVFKSCK